MSIYIWTVCFLLKSTHKYNICRKKDPSVCIYALRHFFRVYCRHNTFPWLRISYIYVYVYTVRSCGVVFARFRCTVLLFKCHRPNGGPKVCHYVAAINSEKLLSFLAYNFESAVSFPAGLGKWYKTFRRIERIEWHRACNESVRAGEIPTCEELAFKSGLPLTCLCFT